MSVDLIRYDLLVQDALRAVVCRVLTDVARDGLPGDHHLYISFDTTAAGVRLSHRLKERYPEEMTIVLQHQFWDLVVTDLFFEVGLSFNGIAERLHIPFSSLKGFFDPSVKFGLQFEPTAPAAEEEHEPAAATPLRPAPVSSGTVPSTSVPSTSVPATSVPSTGPAAAGAASKAVPGGVADLKAERAKADEGRLPQGTPTEAKRTEVKSGDGKAGAPGPAVARPGLKPEPAKGDAARSVAAKTTTAKPEPAKPEPAKPTSAKPEPAKAEPVKPDAAKAPAEGESEGKDGGRGGAQVVRLDAFRKK